MLIDMSKLSPEVRAALQQDMAAGWAPSLTAYTPSFRDALANATGSGGDGGATGGNGAATAADATRASEAANTAALLMQAVSAMSSNPSNDAATNIQMAIGTVDSMAGMAEDPTGAATIAHDMSLPHAVLFSMKDLKAMVNEPAVPTGGGLWMPESAAKAYAAANAITPQIQSLYASDTAAGKSGAEITADILKLELSQSQSYWDAQDPNHLAGNQKQLAQIRLAVLQQDLAQNGVTA